MDETTELMRQRWLADKTIFDTDEGRIQIAINEFYESIKSYDDDIDKFRKITIMRNNIINMTDTYLKKFKNKLIMKEFYTRLKKAKKTAKNKYQQYMNEIRVIQEYKGIQENIADKLATEFVSECLKVGDDLATK